MPLGVLNFLIGNVWLQSVLVVVGLLEEAQDCVERELVLALSQSTLLLGVHD